MDLLCVSGPELALVVSGVTVGHLVTNPVGYDVALVVGGELVSSSVGHERTVDEGEGGFKSEVRSSTNTSDPPTATFRLPAPYAVVDVITESVLKAYLTIVTGEANSDSRLEFSAASYREEVSRG